ncbi:hypothetical protein K437DRAFT_260331 [Tilletiaria anomala UBC 951]|uniref:Uncharacterized protein n=1 Tax=Tilletiaria anomala (strain ATCC 24038 / CBS 436.72 / UBC 951) TaxID=1037660 RepID=A0A066V2F0_TILAU|nr:uncharacterized protein K437DRAFT_260331 [Tilletiaria anomala UBC 951]KDN35646.1 hypothetical protein K437DRAFT_260331 [Tilletiaria anomala UBC 951]
MGRKLFTGWASVPALSSGSKRPARRVQARVIVVWHVPTIWTAQTCPRLNPPVDPSAAALLCACLPWKGGGSERLAVSGGAG